MLTYLGEGRENDSGWLRKEEAVANKEVVKERKSRVQLNLPHHNCNNDVLELNE